MDFSMKLLTGAIFCGLIFFAGKYIPGIWARMFDVSTLFAWFNLYFLLVERWFFHLLDPRTGMYRLMMHPYALYFYIAVMVFAIAASPFFNGPIYWIKWIVYMISIIMGIYFLFHSSFGGTAGPIVAFSIILQYDIKRRKNQYTRNHWLQGETAFIR